MPDADTTPQAATAQDGAEAGEATSAAAPSRSVEELLAEAQARFEAKHEAWLRALADAENARRRAQQDIANAHKFGVERLAESLLPVADALEATLAADAASVEALRSGVELTLKQLRSAFDKASLSEIAPAAGEKFDPHRHQAMAAVESSVEPNSVVAVLQKGWRLHERVIRPALVTVAKPAAAPDA